jgi:hypothetical protein
VKPSHLKPSWETKLKSQITGKEPEVLDFDAFQIHRTLDSSLNKIKGPPNAVVIRPGS